MADRLTALLKERPSSDISQQTKISSLSLRPSCLSSRPSLESEQKDSNLLQIQLQI